MLVLFHFRTSTYRCSSKWIISKLFKKIGPDPASINAAMIGGIAANNASGMCCGISQNSYKTLKSMKLIFCRWNKT